MGIGIAIGIAIGRDRSDYRQTYPERKRAPWRITIPGRVGREAVIIIGRGDIEVRSRSFVFFPPLCISPELYTRLINPARSNESKEDVS